MPDKSIAHGAGIAQHGVHITERIQSTRSTRSAKYGTHKAQRTHAHRAHEGHRMRALHGVAHRTGNAHRAHTRKDRTLAARWLRVQNASIVCWSLRAWADYQLSESGWEMILFHFFEACRGVPITKLPDWVAPAKNRSRHC